MLPNHGSSIVVKFNFDNNEHPDLPWREVMKRVDKVITDELALHPNVGWKVIRNEVVSLENKSFEG